MMTKAGFNSKFGIKGTIGAIDCTHVPIISPPVLDSIRPAHLYMNRKGYYSINVEAICDSQLLFLSINAKFPGSCHDSAIWTTSPARINLIQTHNRRNFNWLLGDSGYPLEPWLLTPIMEPETDKERRFNSLQKKARNTIERAFGVLKSHFRCISKHRVLHYTPQKAAIITYTCAILHNILIQQGYEETVEEDEDVNNNEDNIISDEINDCNDYLSEGRDTRNRYVQTL